MEDNQDTFEMEIILTMYNEDLTMGEALNFIMEKNEVDNESVIGMCDFLEYKFDYDMDKVEYYMDVLVGRAPDQILNKT